jgi:succinyl-CoA synthetase beta subunit
VLGQRRAVDYSVAETPAEARAAAQAYLATGAGRVVIKAQVLVGGRGKAGGVKLAASPRRPSRSPAQILGMDIKGITVRACSSRRRPRSSTSTTSLCVLDRAARRVLFMGSAEGGVEIEQVAEENPTRSYASTPTRTSACSTTRRAAGFALGLGAHLRDFVAIAKGLYATMIANDADLVEINPLAIVRDHLPDAPRASRCSASTPRSPSTTRRSPPPRARADARPRRGGPVDVAAREQGISFIKLDGTIGCMVNGAGLAMTTMDLIKRAGGEPANFLDIGGGAKADKVAAAMRSSWPTARAAILVNIFGGIARGDEVARGLVEARRDAGAHVPMVVRIVGTNAEEAARSWPRRPRPQTADSLDEAVEKAVAAAATGAPA